MAAPRRAGRMRLAAKGKAEARSERGAPRGSYPTNTKGRAVAAKAYSTDAIKEVLGFQDPWGYYYGYSTAAAFEERKYQVNVKRNQEADRPTGDKMPGFHPESYDLWSTGNSKPRNNPTDTQSKELAWAKWIKN